MPWTSISTASGLDLQIIAKNDRRLWVDDFMQEEPHSRIRRGGLGPWQPSWN